MSRSVMIRRPMAALALLAAAFLGGLVALPIANRLERGPDRVPVFISSTSAQAPANLGTLAPIVAKLTPAVVNISSARVARGQQGRRGRGEGQNPFDSPQFREFFGDNFPGGLPPSGPQERRQEGLGSGVIVSPEGYILTNEHVVSGATDITVALNDGRELRAKLVGSDPPTDIAVLQVTEKNLPTVPMGDSAKVAVGDFALAIGNPFGIGQSVTFGIIGATGRGGLNIEQYEDFIQTDAAINPGNSGGALTNTRGELIGINTAILSRGGGNQGVGFAIPINLAMNVMQQILKSGRVTRGYIGVTIQEITPALARSFGLNNADGVVITSVEPNSPAARAGLQTGDVITEFNGEQVRTVSAFRLRVSQTPPNTSVKLTTLRNNQPRPVTLSLAELPSERAALGEQGAPGAASPLEGVEVETLSPQVARQLNLPANSRGLVVVSISQASTAYGAGLRRGDVIQEVNRQPVASIQEFQRAVTAAGDRPVLLLVNRGGQTTFIAVERGR
ncbi:MAG: DegQ family serine endoprotease [Bryobacteraceae bacterium]|nr:DegQ family serine endoprotease [Bryobacteraceae bacterium]